MEHLKTIKDEVLSWSHTSAYPHRFGGVEFRFDKAEIGHIHLGGVLDIPFPKSIRNALLADALAEEHPWVPDSGWTTFRIRAANDAAHAIWLLRLSYLRYALKTATAPCELLDEEVRLRRLDMRFKSLLEPFASSAPDTPVLHV